jgi:hypothetical protein
LNHRGTGQDLLLGSEFEKVRESVGYLESVQDEIIAGNGLTISKNDQYQGYQEK